ncbi:RNA-directed DNA methylation 4 isoform X2 [Mangifera indica]|uniref:RNA-directed DNA methylation 4 isoform X2 n=1 Tax=Mangifera indica TaxID=29780 RepID=UPI001CF9DDD4|nr:RNA-directed DNA methylation 4 isoform X2 [Mangifera indica]
MAGTSVESSSNPPKPTSDRPVIVRVKRKATQSRVDAFWLEINERPLKRPLLDFEKLSISQSSGKEELKAKKVFVQHVETVTTSEATVEIVQSFVLSNSADAHHGETKSEERRRSFNKENRQDQTLIKARHQQEVLAKTARFEQIWRSRTRNKEEMSNKSLHEMCQFYDIVRVDVEQKANEVQKQNRDISLEDSRLLSSYLPLLRDFIPSAAEEIEADMRSYMSAQDDYVYDYYTVNDDMNVDEEDASHSFPLVQVDEDDFYDGPDVSEYDSEDSNAEDNPRNEYPDEISEEEEEEGEEEEEEDESEDESERESSSAASDVGRFSEYYDYLSDDSLHLDYYGNEEDDGDDANNCYSYR